MILMDLRADNLLCFNDFHINFSYPKKIVDSYIENECLDGEPNFRYKKLIILMGSNATGKTSLGRLIMSIFNFMAHKNVDVITTAISDKKSEASFTTDFVVNIDNKYYMYRIKAVFNPPREDKYTSENIDVRVYSIKLRKGDNYERCAVRLGNSIKDDSHENYVAELEKIRGLTWFFIFPADEPGHVKYSAKNEEVYVKVMSAILRLLDPAIDSVEKIDGVENSYVIRMNGNEVIIQDGSVAKANVLSTGTVAGLDIAAMLASMCMGQYGFYYCDEKFSYVNGDIERAILVTMINKLKKDSQLFFTTHNYDVLDMPLPKHSFYLMRKEITDGRQRITVVNAGDYLKKNTDSVRNAVENDLFLSAPSLDLLDDLDEL